MSVKIYNHLRINSKPTSFDLTWDVTSRLDLLFSSHLLEMEIFFEVKVVKLPPHISLTAATYLRVIKNRLIENSET